MVAPDDVTVPEPSDQALRDLIRYELDRTASKKDIPLTAVASAVKLQGALAEQGRVLRDSGNRRLSGSQLLERVTPALRVGASESARFDRALDEYRQVVDRCGLRLP